jgi:protein phosphatase
VTTLRGAGCSDRGPVRRINEDAFLIDEAIGLFAVADGMGGHAAGEVASRLAIEAVAGFLRRSHGEHEYSWPYGIDAQLSLNANRLRTAVHLANRRVFRAAESHDDYTGMGTTVVAVLAAQDQLSIAHVGDSRLYIVAGGRLVQATRDDSWAATVLGQPSFDTVKTPLHPMCNVLTNVLGARDQTEIHIQERTVTEGDRLMLCTDGLHGVLPDQRILEILNHEASVNAAAAALVRAAIEGGSRDNVTALVVEWQ